MKVALDRARICASGEHVAYDPDRGGYVCGGCGRHFAMRSINVHVRAARLRVHHADVVVR